MSHPLPQEMPLHFMFPLYIINSLEVEGAVVSPSAHPAYLAPALFMFGLLSVVFCISCHPQLWFLGQARVACKSWQIPSPLSKVYLNIIFLMRPTLTTVLNTMH
jgi:hypothetical protein